MIETGVEWEGLDARGEWPPLLRDGCLMDCGSYDAWEQLGVAIFAREELSAEAAFDLLAEATERIRTWSPASHAESLDERVAAVAAWSAEPRGMRPLRDRTGPPCRCRRAVSVRPRTDGRAANVGQTLCGGEPRRLPADPDTPELACASG